jgi:type 1 glutamine amidotransferase
MKLRKSGVITALAFASVCAVAGAQTKPLKALLITGGCCHDYKSQKDILKSGIESRANIVVDQIHTDNGSTTPDLPIYDNPDYAAGYDVVIHDECAAGISSEKTVKDILEPHRKGIPGVNLHCAMHSYRVAGFDQKITAPGKPATLWFEYLGLQSTGHGAQKPIEIKYTEKKHTASLGLQDWTTGNEELYNVLHVFDSAQVLATGSQEGKEVPVTWTNDYKGTRVFNTTIGHNNATLEDSRYLDLVTRGLLWATGKLDAQGKVVKGYGRRPAPEPRD